MSSHITLPMTKSVNEYFYRQDRQLIAVLANQVREAEARADDLARRQAHWMHCPHCGATMGERILGGRVIDQCPECEGVYLSARMWQQVTPGETAPSFLTTLHRLLGGETTGLSS